MCCYRYLPIQLKLDGVSSQNANMEARSVIEQRMQSLVGALSCVENVLKQQKRSPSSSSFNQPGGLSRSSSSLLGKKKLLNTSSSSSFPTTTEPSPVLPASSTSSSSSSSSSSSTSTSTPLMDEAPLKVVGEESLINMIWHDKNSLVRSLLDAIEKEEKTYQTQFLLNDNTEKIGANNRGGGPAGTRVLIGQRLRRFLGMRTVEEEKQMKLKRKLSKKQANHQAQVAGNTSLVSASLATVPSSSSLSTSLANLSATANLANVSSNALSTVQSMTNHGMIGMNNNMPNTMHANTANSGVVGLVGFGNSSINPSTRVGGIAFSNDDISAMSAVQQASLLDLQRAMNGQLNPTTTSFPTSPMMSTKPPNTNLTTGNLTTGNLTTSSNVTTANVTTANATSNVLTNSVGLPAPLVTTGTSFSDFLKNEAKENSLKEEPISEALVVIDTASCSTALLEVRKLLLEAAYSYSVIKTCFLLFLLFPPIYRKSCLVSIYSLSVCLRCII